MTGATKPAARRRAPRGSGEQLRAEIVGAAKQLLATTANSDAVSIRAVADAVGVTPPSIYLHFADKEALIDAVVIDVFADLDRAIMAAADGVEEPIERICALGLAYVDFAVEHPEHYRVATMERCAVGDGRAEPDELDQMLADSSFNHLVEAVDAAIAAGVFAQPDPLPVALELWSAAHGVAALMVSKPYLPWGDKQEFAARVLRAAVLGRVAIDQGR